ncbi:MAG: hypothetical protein LBU70_09395 [Chitinispirillales bacterium]|jgi:hypothetical protein|nr:hypothetical protein [Chitinispirillales bacterium]
MLRVTFYAYGRGAIIDGDEGKKGKGSKTGHAFVQFRKNDVRQTVGFNPAEDDTFFSEVGKLDVDEGRYIAHANDGGTSRCFQIRDQDERLFNEALGVAYAWIAEKRSYVLGIQDCISFVYAVAGALGLAHGGIVTTGDIFPVAAVNSIRLNDGADPVNGPITFVQL